MISHIQNIFRLALLNRWVTFFTGSLVTLLVVGCATDRLAWRDRLNPWADDSSVATSGVGTISDRIDQIRELQNSAAKMSEGERSEVARRLTNILASDAESAIKTQVIESLGYFETAKSVEGLRGALQDPDPDMRTAACRSLGRIHSPSAMRSLIEAQRSDTNIDVRQAAIRELGKFSDSAAVAALGESLNDSDPAVQLLAMRSLQQATGEKLGDDIRQWKEHVANIPGGGPRLSELPTERR